ncbi:hypothetical protein [Streptomyces sp. H51]|uniref:hypothetical protein n=1 Tax=Streptomyces sp. H51 TaxID=3111770 RepID=UPI002D77D773|nr:hypothetical protein [Streptomyces sp. H51]
MSALTLASAPEDAAALETAEAHRALLAGESAGRVTAPLAAVDHDPGAAGRILAGLVAFREREPLPHAAADNGVPRPGGSASAATDPAQHKPADAAPSRSALTYGRSGRPQ